MSWDASRMATVPDFENTHPRRRVLLRLRGETWDTTTECVAGHSRIIRKLRRGGLWQLTDDWVRVSDLDGRRLAAVLLKRK